MYSFKSSYLVTSISVSYTSDAVAQCNIEFLIRKPQVRIIASRTIVRKSAHTSLTVRNLAIVVTNITHLLVIRSNVPRLELDQAFESKDDVARAVKEQLSALMQEYGYEILGTSKAIVMI